MIDRAGIGLAYVCRGKSKIIDQSFVCTIKGKRERERGLLLQLSKHGN